MKLFVPENLYQCLEVVIEDEDDLLWFDLPEPVSFADVEIKMQPTVRWQDAVQKIFSSLGFGWRVATATALRLARDDISQALVAETRRPLLSLELGDQRANVLFSNYDADGDLVLEDGVSLVVLGDLKVKGKVSCGKGELIVIGDLQADSQEHRDGSKVFVSGAPRRQEPA
jgi:hypothetical protein